MGGFYQGIKDKGKRICVLFESLTPPPPQKKILKSVTAFPSEKTISLPVVNL